MLAVLTTADYPKTFQSLEKHAASTRPRRLTYEWLFQQRAVPGGTWVFTDLERLSAVELSHAASLAAALEGEGSRVLNNPARVITRADLLTRLHAEGINRFRAYPAGAMPKPDRFPVLLKSAVDHRQPDVTLYRSQSELDDALGRLRDRGIALRDMLVIEYCAAPIREGAFRKHSVFRVGDAFLSHTMVIEDSWAVKYGTAGFSTDGELAEAVREIDDNPYREVMKPIFEIAGIDYGRSDFGFTPDGIAVYEINTNPVVPGTMKTHRVQAYADACDRSAVRIREAICNLPHQDLPEIETPWSKVLKRSFDVGFRYRLERP